MPAASDPRARFLENPFYVLGLRPDATRAEVEREGQKLLGMLELRLSSVATYATPVGTATRTADAVRRAMAELRSPEKRIVHELWARIAPEPVAAPPAADRPERPAPLAGALAALGLARVERG